MGTDLISATTLNQFLLATFGAFLVFLTTWFWRGKTEALLKAKTLSEAHEAVLARLSVVETQLKLTEQMTSPIVTAMQAILVKQLTHAHRPELDALLVKIGPPDILTDQERARLLVLLHDRSWDVDPSVGTEERSAAKILPLLMPMAVAEQKAFAEAGVSANLRLMTIVAVVGAPEPLVDAEDHRLTKA